MLPLQLVEMLKLKHHAVKKKLRMHFEALAGHNKELRTQLAAVHKQLTEEQVGSGMLHHWGIRLAESMLRADSDDL